MNLDNQSVPVHNQGDKQPFQTSCFVDPIPVGKGFGNCTFAVPAGKRLVIEYASIDGQAPSGQSMSAGISTVGPSGLNYHVPMTPIGASISPGFDAFIAGQAVKFYADPGTTVTCVATRNSVVGITSGIQFTFSGYLIDVP